MEATFRSLQQYTAPTLEPLSLQQAKGHLHVSHSAEDEMITAMITVARRAVEDATALSLVHTTWVERHDGFPSADELIFARSPLVSVTSVAYVNAAGTSATMTVTTDYLLDIYTIPGRIYLAHSASWPATYGEPNDVTLTYVAGFGDEAAEVPVQFVQAMKLALGDLYANRERYAVEQQYELPTYVRMMLNERAAFTF